MQYTRPNLFYLGIVYLYMKTPERAHSPAKMWERKKLSKNYAQALSQVNIQLEIFLQKKKTLLLSY